jgi:hypothetical protein
MTMGEASIVVARTGNVNDGRRLFTAAWKSGSIVEQVGNLPHKRSQLENGSALSTTGGAFTRRIGRLMPT